MILPVNNNVATFKVADDQNSVEESVGFWGWIRNTTRRIKDALFKEKSVIGAFLDILNDLLDDGNINWSTDSREFVVALTDWEAKTLDTWIDEKFTPFFTAQAKKIGASVEGLLAARPIPNTIYNAAQTALIQNVNEVRRAMAILSAMTLPEFFPDWNDDMVKARNGFVDDRLKKLENAILMQLNNSGIINPSILISREEASAVTNLDGIQLFWNGKVVTTTYGRIEVDSTGNISEEDNTTGGGATTGGNTATETPDKSKTPVVGKVIGWSLVALIAAKTIKTLTGNNNSNNKSKSN